LLTTRNMDAKPPARPRSRIGSGPDRLPRGRSVLLLVDFISAEDIAAGALAAAKMTAQPQRRLARRGVAEASRGTPFATQPAWVRAARAARMTFQPRSKP